MPVIKRNELFNDVWNRPCTKIAADLGISSSALKKICVAMNISTPPVGHWTRVECGKKVKQAKLPKARADTRLEWDIDLANSKRQRSPRAAGPTPQEKESFPEVPIAPDLTNLHPLVKATRAQLREDWSNKSWDKRKDRKRLHAEVSKDSLDRALLFLDALARGIEAQGLVFGSDLDDPELKEQFKKPRWERSKKVTGCCWVGAAGERVRFTLSESNKRVSVSDEAKKKRWHYQDWEAVPSGKLTLSINAGYGFGRRSKWRDGKI